MCHLRPGLGGLFAAVLFGIVFAALALWLLPDFEAFNLDPGGEKGAFDPFLLKYIRVAEYVITLATGSIVLLVGSFSLHGQGGSLPWVYASPLVLLAFSALYGICFMTWLIYEYEEYQHGEQHTRRKYAVSLTLGFSSLACFLAGYLWLIFRVAGVG